MNRIVLAIVCLLLVSCASTSGEQYVLGGERVNQPGVSFMPPTNQDWKVIVRTAYQSAFGALDTPKDDTLIVSSTSYKILPVATKEDFLKLVREARAAEPNTGRFEVIRNAEQLYEGRSETCVIYRSASKDFGVEAKRGEQYSVLETIGMHCVHPNKSNVGIQVEFSRKAPSTIAYPHFEIVGLTLLQSVRFGEF